MSRWFKFYDTVLDDPKVQRLADHLFRGWVNILCLASKNNGSLPSISDIGFCLRIPNDQADSLVQALLDAGLLEDNGECLSPHNWAERQFVDRTNADRQQRFRDKKKAEALRKSVTNGKVTALDIEEEKIRKEKKRNNSTRSPALASEFVQFWKSYPRRIAKPAAEKAWIKATALTNPREILEGLQRYNFPSDSQFVPHPATWLNQRRWEDEASARPLSLMEQYAQRARELEEEARNPSNLFILKGN